MFDLGYVKPEEVPQIPRLPKTPVAILYSPLGDSPVDPDVVLFACKPSAAMLLNEAAGRAGVASGMPALGRPTCMALPATMAHGSILSLGCMGNRVYTGLGEDEMYLVLRGKDLAESRRRARCDHQRKFTRYSNTPQAAATISRRFSG